MKKALSFVFFSMAAALIITSCKKGDRGEPGTANVLYSAWFTPSTYKKDTLYGIWGFSHIQATPAITQTVLDTGTVLTFAKMTGYNQAVWPTGRVGQLPITINYVQGGLQVDTWQAYYSPGNLTIRFTNDHNIYTSISNTHSFRYIVIPGGASTGRRAQLSYSELCRQYNIPE